MMACHALATLPEIARRTRASVTSQVGTPINLVIAGSTFQGVRGTILAGGTVDATVSLVVDRLVG
jgi:hypothetical protein